MLNYDTLPTNAERRDAAQAAGLTRFLPIGPCKRGHVSDRFTSNGGCVRCMVRKVVKANSVRGLMTFRAPVLNTLTRAQQVALYNYLGRCVIAWHESIGQHAPLNPSAIQMGELQGVPFDEC